MFSKCVRQMAAEVLFEGIAKRDTMAAVSFSVSRNMKGVEHV